MARRELPRDFSVDATAVKREGRIAGRGPALDRGGGENRAYSANLGSRPGTGGNLSSGQPEYFASL